MSAIRERPDARIEVRLNARLDPRLELALLGARRVSSISRRLHLGGGTSAPGRLASQIDPRALEKLSRRLTEGVVLVAGTNGKTTTARLMAEILAADGRRVVHNRAGANMVGGIVSALTAGATAADVRQRSLAVLECDEAALPELIARTAPRLVVLTNLFRDQLDRYGEMDLVQERWRTALMSLPRSTTLTVNADDPQLVALTDGLDARRTLYGIAESPVTLPVVPHAAEVVLCPQCGEPFRYGAIFVGHLGAWHCRSCGIERPALDVAGRAIELTSLARQTLEAAAPGGVSHIDVGLPGLFNTYNVLAALAAVDVLGVPEQTSRRALASYRGAFGRAELVRHDCRDMLIMLVKNPVGANEVLRTISDASKEADSPLLLCLNDHAADGRDVSWIWDVDFELLSSRAGDVFCAGSRWADMRNRLYYGGIDPTRIHGLGPDVAVALDRFADAVPEGGLGFVLPTYSAMLTLRAAIGPPAERAAFWDR